MVNIAEAKAKLSQLIQECLDGEEIVLCKHNKPAVNLTPCVSGEKGLGAQRGKAFGILADKIHYAPDWDGVSSPLTEEETDELGTLPPELLD